MSATSDPLAGVQRSQTYEGFMPILELAGKLGCAKSCGCKRFFVNIALEPITPPKVGIHGGLFQIQYRRWGLNLNSMVWDEFQANFTYDF